jgi:hypothetical protein
VNAFIYWPSLCLILVIRLLCCVLCLYFCILILATILFHEGLRQVALEWNLEMMILMLSSLSKYFGTYIFVFSVHGADFVAISDI